MYVVDTAFSFSRSPPTVMAFYWHLLLYSFNLKYVFACCFCPVWLTFLKNPGQLLLVSLNWMWSRDNFEYEHAYWHLSPFMCITWKIQDIHPEFFLAEYTACESRHICKVLVKYYVKSRITSSQILKQCSLTTYALFSPYQLKMSRNHLIPVLDWLSHTFTC